MKMVIFLVLVIAVVSAMVWSMRKSQAKADLAKHKLHARRKKQHKESITPVDHVVWPTVGLPVAGRQALNEGSESDDPEEGKLTEEPSMTTIEYVPSQHMSS